MKPGASTIHALVSVMRLRQYAKNLIIFTPAFFDGTITQPWVFYQTAIVFIVFCLAASAMYVLNDLFDLENDKNHPTKKLRALASGRLVLKTAIILITILILISGLLAFVVNPTIFLIILFYFIMNAGYSAGLKNIPVVDLLIVSTGFVLRLLAGGVATDTELTAWIITLTFLLALVLVTSKRYHDLSFLIETGTLTRPVISKYNVGILNTIILVSSILIITLYFVWSLFSDTFPRSNPDILYLSTVFVGLGLFRYLQIMFSSNHTGNPLDVFYKDRTIQLYILGWMIFIVWYFYLI